MHWFGISVLITKTEKTNDLHFGSETISLIKSLCSCEERNENNLIETVGH